MEEKRGQVPRWDMLTAREDKTRDTKVEAMFSTGLPPPYLFVYYTSELSEKSVITTKRNFPWR